MTESTMIINNYPNLIKHIGQVWIKIKIIYITLFLNCCYLAHFVGAWSHTPLRDV